MIVDVRVMTTGGPLTFSVDDDEYLKKVVDYLDRAVMESDNREYLRFGEPPFVCMFKVGSVIGYSIHKSDNELRQSIIDALKTGRLEGDEWRSE